MNYLKVNPGLLAEYLKSAAIHVYYKLIKLQVNQDYNIKENQKQKQQNQYKFYQIPGKLQLFCAYCGALCVIASIFLLFFNRYNWFKSISKKNR